MWKSSKKRAHFINFLGILFLAAGITRIIVLILVSDLKYFAWFSNHVLILLGIGVLMRSKLIVTAELCIALVPETLWTLDFMSKLLFNRYLFGVTQYVFEQEMNLATITSLQHLLIVPLGMLALLLLGVSSKAWKFSFIHATMLWIAGFFIGKEYNINCVFTHCITYFENLPIYIIAWPIIVIALILLSNLLLLGLNLLRKR